MGGWTSKTVDLPKDIDEVGDNQSDIVNSKRMKRYIINEIIQPFFIKTINDILEWQAKWKKIGNISLFMSKACVICAGIFSLASEYFGVSYLGFVSGCLSFLGIFMMDFSKFSFQESRERTEEADRILSRLGLDPIVPVMKHNDNDDNDDHDIEAAASSVAKPSTSSQLVSRNRDEKL